MKRFALLTCLAVLLALPARGEVETAADYFNLGAATFIRANPEQALAIVNEGLVFFPEDESLLRLKALIEQQEEQQNQDSSEDSEQEDQDSESEENGSDENQNDQQPDEEEQSDEEEQEQESDDNETSEEPADEEEREQPQPGDMNEDEAEMVLDSLRQLEEAQRERIMQDMIRRQMQNMPPVEKDW